MLSIEKARENPPPKNSKREKHNLTDKKFKALIIKMLTKIGKRMDVHSESFKKELKNIKNTQTEMNNSIAEIKKKNTRRNE